MDAIASSGGRGATDAGIATPAQPAASAPAARVGIEGMDVRQLPPEEYGALLFKARGCVTCHGPGRRSPIGADLAGLYGSTVQLEGGATATADEAYLREAILEPNAKVVAGFKPLMPAFRGQLDDQQIDALIAYIKTLKKP